MPSPPRNRERLNQKRRTRSALLRAAWEILQEGRQPTVAEAAEAALVSRATAYRYFPTQESLLIEAPVEIAVPSPEELFGDGVDTPDDPEDRIELLDRVIHEISCDNEPAVRALLRSTMQRWFERGDEPNGEPLRQDRRGPLIDAALAPVRNKLSRKLYAKLRAALAIVIGIESLVALNDVAHLDRNAAGAVKRWAVRALVRAALQEARRKRKRKS